MSASARTGDANNNHNQALIAAIRNHQLEEVRNLLDLGNIDINGDDRKPFPHPSWKSRTPLGEAIATNDTTIVALLLEYGADPNHGSEVVEMNGKRYYSNQNSMILFATNDILALLLRCGADPNAIHPSRSGSPLHFVCYYADYDKIELLLQHGANPNLPDRNGKSPVFRLLCLRDNFDNNRLSCLRLLLEYGADPNAIESFGGMPPLFLVIHNARGECRLDVIRLMMRHGADATVPLSIKPLLYLRCGNCIKGDTIWHAAVRLRDVNAIHLMTEHQETTWAFWSYKNDDGETVYDLAAKLDVAPIIEYFNMRLRQECYAYLLHD